MKAIVGAVLLVLAFVAMGTASATSEYSQYVNQKVSVNCGNQFVVQGVMLADGPNAIIVKELCNETLGTYIINKNIIIAIWPGFECGIGDYCVIDGTQKVA